MILERLPEFRIQECNIERSKLKDLDSVTQLMKELRLSQVEAQKRLDEQMLFMRDVFTKSVAAIAQPMYVAPNQYGNQEYLLPHGGFIEGGWNWSIFHYGDLSFASSTFFNPLRRVCLLFKFVLTRLDVFCLPFLTCFDMF